MIVQDEFLSLTNQIHESEARLIAVSKTKPIHNIQQLYDLGQRHFGENRVPELVEKHTVLPDDIQWHMIGSLRNKVKYIAPFVSLIHSIDSLRLLAEVDKQAQKHDRVIDCLLQFHIAEEMTKSGLDWEAVVELLHSSAYKQMRHIRLVGVMGMATFTNNELQVAAGLSSLLQYLIGLKTRISIKFLLSKKFQWACLVIIY